jgi:ABC-2 type transport system ATP-binding protein
MPSILEANQLVKKYGNFTAVNGVSFDIRAGEIFGLLGPNGAGKTTIISMLSTLYAPTSGDATVAGYSVVKDPSSVRQVIGVVPQDLALYDDLSGRENLAFWGKMYGITRWELGSRIEEVLEQIGLRDKASQRVKTYSGGMKRRLNIGVGLLNRPRLLIMDEPTVGIDPQSRRAILDAIKELNREGMSILYTTHYMEEAQELSNRIGIMDHGSLIALGTQKELSRQIGENDTLILHIDASQDGETLASGIRSIAGVMRAEASDHKVAVIAPEAEEILVPAITKASSLGIKIRSVDIQEPDLEAVFLSITGRALRD